MVKNPKEFLAKAHVILPVLLKPKSQLPKINYGHSHDAFRNFLIIQDAPDDKDPAIEEFIEDAN